MAGLNTLGDKTSVRGIIGGDTIPGADRSAKRAELKRNKIALTGCSMNDILAYYGSLADAIDKEVFLDFIAQNFSRKRFHAECDPTKVVALPPEDQAAIHEIFSDRALYLEVTLPDLKDKYKQIVAGVLEVAPDELPEEVIEGIINKNSTLLEEIYDLTKYINKNPGAADIKMKEAELGLKRKTLKDDILPNLKDLKSGIHLLITKAESKPLDFGARLDPHIDMISHNITSKNMFDGFWKRINAFYQRGRLKETIAYLNEIKQPEQGLLLLYGLYTYKFKNLIMASKATEGIFFTRWLSKGSQNRDKFKQECMTTLQEHFNRISPSDEERPLLIAVQARFEKVIEEYENKMKAQYSG